MTHTLGLKNKAMICHWDKKFWGCILDELYWKKHLLCKQKSRCHKKLCFLVCSPLYSRPLCGFVLLEAQIHHHHNTQIRVFQESLWSRTKCSWLVSTLEADPGYRASLSQQLLIKVSLHLGSAQLGGNSLIYFPGPWFLFANIRCCCFSSFIKSCLTLCDCMDCNTPGLPALLYLPKFAQVHVHWVGDAIQSSHPLSPSSPSVSIFPSIRVFSNESVVGFKLNLMKSSTAQWMGELALHTCGPYGYRMGRGWHGHWTSLWGSWRESWTGQISADFSMMSSVNSRYIPNMFWTWASTHSISLPERAVWARQPLHTRLLYSPCFLCPGLQDRTKLPSTSFLP